MQFTRWGNIMKWWKDYQTLALLVSLSYMTTILGVWIYANIIQGSDYFLAGEPNLIIKYVEWSLGMVAIIGLVGMIKQRLNYIVEERKRESA